MYSHPHELRVSILDLKVVHLVVMLGTCENIQISLCSIYVWTCYVLSIYVLFHHDLTVVLLQGVLKVNQYIEVRPGIVVKDEAGNIKCTPIYSRIVSLFAEQNELQFAVPGGLIGVGTTMDPTLTRADRLVGQVLGAVGSLPDIFVELEVCYIFASKIICCLSN